MSFIKKITFTNNENQTNYTYEDIEPDFDESINSTDLLLKKISSVKLLHLTDFTKYIDKLDVSELRKLKNIDARKIYYPSHNVPRVDDWPLTSKEKRIKELVKEAIENHPKTLEKDQNNKDGGEREIYYKINKTFYSKFSLSNKIVLDDEVNEITSSILNVNLDEGKTGKINNINEEIDDSIEKANTFLDGLKWRFDIKENKIEENKIEENKIEEKENIKEFENNFNENLELLKNKESGIWKINPKEWEPLLNPDYMDPNSKNKDEIVNYLMKNLNIDLFPQELNNSEQQLSLNDVLFSIMNDSRVKHLISVYEILQKKKNFSEEIAKDSIPTRYILQFIVNNQSEYFDYIVVPFQTVCTKMFIL